MEHHSVGTNTTPAAAYAFDDSGTTEVWLEYVQKRFEDASKRIDEFRSWGRQFIGWIAAVIALEANLFPKMSERLHLLRAAWNTSAIIAMGLIIVVQLLILWKAMRTGFSSTGVQSPEDPSKLAPHLVNVPAQRAREMIAAYFAKSYDTYNGLAQNASRDVKIVTTSFVLTVWAFALTAAALFWFTRQ